MTSLSVVDLAGVYHILQCELNLARKSWIAFLKIVSVYTLIFEFSKKQACIKTAPPGLNRTVLKSGTSCERCGLHETVIGIKMINRRGSN